MAFHLVQHFFSSEVQALEHCEQIELRKNITLLSHNKSLPFVWMETFASYINMIGNFHFVETPILGDDEMVNNYYLS
jgi:hypothetical protein